MLRRVALERNYVSKECSASFIRVRKISELETTLAVTSNRPSCEEIPMDARYEEISMVFLRSVRRLLVTASVIPSSPILVTLMKEALRSSET
jgi:hypothetical protein